MSSKKIKLFLIPPKLRNLISKNSPAFEQNLVIRKSILHYTNNNRKHFIEKIFKIK